MDKSFNDDELADIMNEIESLEKEFAESAPASEAETEEFAPTDEIDHTAPEVVSHIMSMPVEEVARKSNHEEKVVPMKRVDHAPQAHQHSTLSFKVEGQMTLSLAFEVNGQSVSLEISDAGLQIQMESGASFNLPMSHTGAAKKAA